MIPHTITRANLLGAIRLLDAGKEVVPPNRRSTKYDLLHRRRRYPPKYVIFIANRVVSGRNLRRFAGGSETNNFLLARGFTVVAKNDGKPVGITLIKEDEESRFPEGRRKYRLHRSYERDSRIVRLAKQRRLQQTGRLLCEVCNFCFQQKYGPLGVGYIEAHHTIPVSELRSKQKTRIQDIALVCSNCHRMLHAGIGVSIQSLKAELAK